MSGILEKVRGGLPLDDVLVIDGHCHIGLWHNFNVPRGSADDMLVTMDALGVDMACVTAHSSIGGDYRFGNDLAMDAARRYPDRFTAYMTINPNYPELISEEIERCMKEPGVRVIKLHPSMHGCPIDYKGYQPVYEYADEHNVTVLIHTWGKGEIAEMDSVSGHYPNASFIIGHTGAEIRAMEKAIDLINKRENCYADLAISMAREGNVEWFVREVGSEKVIYGTDMPFFDPKPVFGRIAYAEISDKDKMNILGINMKKLLHLA